MTDGSYIQVCSETYPGKVSWGSGDHSAITTSTSGVWISKWNKYPLIRHAWNDTPYGTSNLKYYASTKINGDVSVLCTGTRNYSTQNISGATYTWTVNGSLQILSGQGTNQIQVQRNGSASGLGIVTVQISTSCSSSSATSQIQFVVGPAQVSSVSLYSTSCIGGSEFEALYSIIGTGSGYTINIPPSYEYYIVSIDGSYLYASVSSANVFIPIEITPYTNGCGQSSTYYWGLYTSACGYGGYSYSISPNPTSDELTIEVDNSKKSDNNKTQFEVKLINSSGKVVKEMSGLDRLTLDVSKIQKGNYFIHIVDGKGTLKKQIVIQ